MSMESWKLIYYPVSAQQIVADTCNGKDQKIKLIEHSLQKWRGLMPDALYAHGLTRCERLIYSGKYDTFAVEDTSCALCVKYYDTEAICSHQGHGCDSCPITDAFGKKHYGSDDCDQCETCWYAYSHFTRTGNPSQMITQLEMTLAFVKEHGDENQNQNA